MTTPRIVGASNIRHYAFDGSIAVPLYSLMYHDSDDVKPAASQTDQGAEIENQRLFAKNFVGLAADSRLATDTDADTNFPIITEDVAEFDCPSSTWEHGDLVAIDEASSGTALENQKVVKTTDPTCAIGVCVQREASATTTVRVHFKGKHADIDKSPLQEIVQVIAYDDFTDNTDATGYIDLTDQLPAGSIVLGWEAIVATGFTGDTTAVAQLGIAGDLNKFSVVTTTSVLAAATVSCSSGGDVNVFQNAATTLRFTVTGGSDFGGISAGSLTLRVLYLAT